jgi:hypothetical protein
MSQALGAKNFRIFLSCAQCYERQYLPLQLTEQTDNEYKFSSYDKESRWKERLHYVDIHFA